jgi:hypothetical protein
MLAVLAAHIEPQCICMQGYPPGGGYGLMRGRGQLQDIMLAQPVQTPCLPGQAAGACSQPCSSRPQQHPQAQVLSWRIEASYWLFESRHTIQPCIAWIARQMQRKHAWTMLHSARHDARRSLVGSHILAHGGEEAVGSAPNHPVKAAC